jgi:hypothetical protein
MKRKLFLLSAMALVITGAMFWSCQKEEMMNTEEGMLKNASLQLPACGAGCINDIQQYNGTLLKGAGVVVGNIEVHNTKENLIVKVISSSYVSSIRVTINDTEYYFDKDEDPISSSIVTYSEPGTASPNKGKILWMMVTLPLDANVSCTEYAISVDADGGGKAEVLYKQYQWCEDCTIRNETAFAGDDVNENASGSWFYYFTAADGSAKIWAGQNEEIGTVTLSAEGLLSISLNGDWKLKTGEAESVKIQGLSEIPSSRLQGKDYSIKNTTLENIDAGEFLYYMIHLDVEICE